MTDSNALSWISAVPDAGVAADLTALTADGTLSRSDALQLLTDIANRGAVTSAELASLQATVANMNLAFTADTGVASALIQIVDGNSANGFWNGGTGTATALGNLQSGTTAAQLNELLAKWFLGTDLPDPTPPAPFSIALTYQASTLPLFGPSGPVTADINQGADGDCVLDAALIEMVRNHPDMVHSMFRDNGDGTYGVRFFVNGGEIWETVNRSLPATSAGALAFSNAGSNPSPSLWVPLVEKAYAQLSATGLTGHPAINSYANIDADPPNIVLANLTGAQAQWYFSADPAWNTYKSLIVAAVASGDDVLVGTGTASADATYDSSGRLMLVADHEQAIVGYDAATGNFILRNPWGTHAGQNWDTQFEASMADIANAQGVVTIDTSAHTALAVVPAPQRIANGAVSTTAWVAAGGAVAVAGLFCATDTAGQPITSYLLQPIGWDAIHLNGAINLGTAAQQAAGQFVISPADLPKVTLSPAGTSGATGLLVAAGDASGFGPLTPLQINIASASASSMVAATHGPAAVLVPGQTTALTALAAVNPGGTYVDIASAQATINLNGATNVSSTAGPIIVRASDLPLLTVTAPSAAGAVDLAVAVSLNSAWSAWSDLVVPVAQSAGPATQAFKNGQALQSTAIADASANVVAHLDTLQAMLAAGQVQQLAVTDQPAQPLAVTGVQLANDAGALALLAGSVPLSATGVSVQTAASLPAGIAAALKSLTVTDTAANLLADHSIAHATAYQLSADAPGLSAGQASTLAALAGFSGNGHGMTVSDTAAAVFAALAPLDPLAAAGTLTKVALTTPGAVTLTEAQLHATNHVVAELSGSMNLAVTMQGAHTQYTIAAGRTGLTISGDGQTENLANVDTLVFTDGIDISFDAAGDPGEAYRIYQAAFNRAPDQGGLGYWIKTLDAGASLTDVANAFVHSNEFSGKYGALDTNGYVDQLYLNVLHRAGDSLGIAYWTQHLAAGDITRAQVLAMFSQSPENEAALVGTIQSGITYTA